MNEIVNASTGEIIEARASRPSDDASVEDWAGYVGEAWLREAAAIIDTGGRLLDARTTKGEDGFAHILAKLGMSPSAAADHVQIFEDPRIGERPAFTLPRSTDTLLELTRTSDDEWRLVDGAGLIKPELKRSELRAFLRGMANRDLASREVELPPGVYETIVIDPPWPMQKIEREVRPNQVGFDYPTMSEEQLAAFPLPDLAADDCHLFLWTTHKFLPMALRLSEAWGFNYVCCFVWHKPGGFQPVGLPQYNCEFALYCRKGAPAFADLKAFPTCFDAKRRQHSRKPDEFYDLIRRVCAGPRIDVFSREPRAGFAQFGNEAQKFGEAA